MDEWGGCIGALIVIAIVIWLIGVVVTGIFLGFAYAGLTILIAIEFLAHGLMAIGIASPTAAWLVLGVLIGSMAGAGLGFKSAGKRSAVPWVLAVGVVMLVGLFLASQSIPTPAAPTLATPLSNSTPTAPPLNAALENKVMIIAPTDEWSVALMIPPDYIQKRLKITWDGNIVAQDDDGNVFNLRINVGLVGRTKTSLRWLRFRSTTGHPVTMYAMSPFPASQCPIITFNPEEPQKGSAKKPQGIPKTKTIEELTARNISGDSGSSTGGPPFVQRDTSVHTLSPGEPPDNSTADSVPSEPHSFKLTPDSPAGQGSATIVGPGNGVQNFNLYYIDTRDFAGGGILEIELKISADSATDGSFDLFPSNVPIPTRGRPSGALIGRHDVRKGTSTRFEYRFTFGQVFVLGVEGNWYSPKGAKGLVQFRVSVRR